MDQEYVPAFACHKKNITSALITLYFTCIEVNFWHVVFSVHCLTTF